MAGAPAPVLAVAPYPPRMIVLTITFLHGGFMPGLREEAAQTTARLRLLADEMVRLRPDVVTVQEALVAARHGSVATRLAGRLAHDVRFAKANPLDHYGLLTELAA